MLAGGGGAILRWAGIDQSINAFSQAVGCLVDVAAAELAKGDSGGRGYRQSAVLILFGVRNKASLIEDVVSCVCVVEDGRKSWDPKLGKLAMTPVAGW